MSTSSARVVGSADLDAIIATNKLQFRSARRADTQFETTSLLKLQSDLAHEPATFFQILVETALTLSKADSTGISLLNKEKNRFVWPAVAGPLSRFIGDGTPADFGPCGTVLERNASLLMIHPERHFDYLAAITPSLEEVLLVPFRFENKAVGTIWAVSHTPGREFDAEDKRLLESLSTFAASAYEMFERLGLLEPLLRPKQS
jgi:GAF domain-containing protein